LAENLAETLRKKLRIGGKFVWIAIPKS